MWLASLWKHLEYGKNLNMSYRKAIEKTETSHCKKLFKLVQKTFSNGKSLRQTEPSVKSGHLTWMFVKWVKNWRTENKCKVVWAIRMVTSAKGRLRHRILQTTTPIIIVYAQHKDLGTQFPVTASALVLWQTSNGKRILVHLEHTKAGWLSYPSVLVKSNITEPARSMSSRDTLLMSP